MAKVTMWLRSHLLNAMYTGGERRAGLMHGDAAGVLSSILDATDKREGMDQFEGPQWVESGGSGQGIRRPLLWVGPLIVASSLERQDP